MPMDELVDRLESQTTRRTIVKTGAKLAYAAPLVAATLKTDALTASAQRVSPIAGGTCAGDFSCGEVPDPCGANEFGTCYCFGNTERQGVCGSNESCAALSSCTTSEDCPNGSHCAVNTCCGEPVCIEDCPESDVEADSFGATSVQSGVTPSGH